MMQFALSMHDAIREDTNQQLYFRISSYISHDAIHIMLRVHLTSFMKTLPICAESLAVELGTWNMMIILEMLQEWTNTFWIQTHPVTFALNTVSEGNR